MFAKRIGSPRRIAGLFGLAFLVQSALAAGLSDFKLIQAIPADAVIVVNGRSHDGQKFVKEQQKRLWEAIQAQNFDKDFKRLMQGMAEENETSAEDFDATWTKFSDLLSGVEWSTLMEREVAFGMKLGFPTIEFVMLTMPPADKVSSSFEGLAALLKSLVEMAPEGTITLATDGQGDATMHTLSFSPNSGIPAALTLARHKETILFGFGQALPTQSLALLRGEKGKSVAAGERFQAAMKKLPAPTDSVSYVDMSALMNQVRGIADGALDMAIKADTTATNPAEAKAQFAWINKLIDAFDLWDYSAAVATTAGMKTSGDGIVVLRDNAKSRPLYKVLYEQGALKEPLKYVPENANSFGANVGVNPMAFYAAIIDFVKNNVPDGAETIKQWEEAKASFEIDPEKDVLAWIEGGWTQFSVPGATQFAQGDWVFILPVSDEAKAQKFLDFVGEKLGPIVQAQKGTVADAKIDGATGFKTVSLPMLMMMPGLSAPTYGLKDRRLFIASSPKIINTALTVAAGGAPNISTSERFKKEGLPPTAKSVAVSFTDLTRFGEELGSVLQMVPMMGAINPEIGKDPAARFAISMISKVGKVVSKIDFLQSSAMVSTLEGDTVVSKTVTNYREPPKPKTDPTTEDSATQGTTGAKN